MDAFTRIKTALQTLADASGVAWVKGSYGTTGAKVEIQNVSYDTGRAYTEPGFIGYLLRAVGGVVEHRRRPPCAWASSTKVQVVAPPGAAAPLTYTLQDGQYYTLAATLDWQPSTGAQDGGLDTGAEEASTWYYLYLVPSNSTANTLTVRGSKTGPATGPSGYTAWLYVGAWYNDSSSDLVKAYQNGSRFRYAGRRVMVSGASSDGSATQMTAGGAPATARDVELAAYFQVSAGNSGELLVWASSQESGGDGAAQLYGLCFPHASVSGGVALPAGVAPYYQRRLITGSAVGSEIAILGWTDAYL